MPEDAWPESREAFAEYWWPAVRELEMDDVSRGYLRDLVNLRLFKPAVQRVLGRWNRFVTVGFLAPEFREVLGEPWSSAISGVSTGSSAARSASIGRSPPRCATRCSTSSNAT